MEVEDYSVLKGIFIKGSFEILSQPSTMKGRFAQRMIEFRKNNYIVDITLKTRIISLRGFEIYLLESLLENDPSMKMNRNEN